MLMKILNSNKKFAKKQINQEDTRVLYCVEAESRNEVLNHAQLITVYDLDNNGILRVGFPGNPFASNMFFGRINEVEFNDMEALNSLKAAGRKAVQTKYLHAFSTIDDLKSATDKDAAVITFDKGTQIVSSIDLYEKEQDLAHVAKK